MKQILLFGAGKSATCLIDYLIQHAASENWHVTIADANLSVIREKTGNAVCTTAVVIDIHDTIKRNELIAKADIVISLMPPALHYQIAQSCIELNKNLLTASYIDDQIKNLETQIKAKGLLFLCEMGLDPGIDHMSAMRLINEIKDKGGVITSFKSHCGGLVAPESDDNPWHYKISWNPRNIVMAGQAGAIYKENGSIYQLTSEQIFANCPNVEVENAGTFAWYANRDSLSYIPIYHLENATTFIRTTLRHPFFCKAWNEIIRLQLTATTDEAIITKCENIIDWFNTKLTSLQQENTSWQAYLDTYVNNIEHDTITAMFDYMGLFSEMKIPAHCKSSADILQFLLEKRLALQSHDKDMIVMVHEMEYILKAATYSVHSALVVKGKDHLRTAMAQTVGLPLGIAAKLILNDVIRLKGLHIPTVSDIYDPVLYELQEYGIVFSEYAYTI